MATDCGLPCCGGPELAKITNSPVFGILIPCHLMALMGYCSPSSWFVDDGGFLVFLPSGKMFCVLLLSSTSNARKRKWKTTGSTGGLLPDSGHEGSYVKEPGRLIGRQHNSHGKGPGFAFYLAIVAQVG